MPPLLEEEIIPSGVSSLLAGTSCENIVSGYLLLKGMNISEPYVDVGVDLLVEMDDGWKKAQVKKVIKKVQNGHQYHYFSFQRNGALKGLVSAIGPKEIDYFYHVLVTPLRQLIRQISSSYVGLKENGTFRTGCSAVLDRFRDSRPSKTTIDFQSFLVDAKYDTKVFQEYPEFFNPSTLNNFLNE